MKDYSPQRLAPWNCSPVFHRARVHMVRQAHHERKKAAHPEPVEGLRDLSASAVQFPSPGTEIALAKLTTQKPEYLNTK